MEKCLKVLALLNEVNSNKEIVPYNAFYIHELTDQLDLEEDYRNWIEHREVAYNVCDHLAVFFISHKDNVVFKMLH